MPIQRGPAAFIVKLADCGRMIAIGHDAFSATAKRLAEEGHDPKTKLTIHFVDGRRFGRGQGGGRVVCLNIIDAIDDPQLYAPWFPARPGTRGRSC